MPKKKYIVKNIDLESVSKNFLKIFTANLTDDNFDKTFMAFVINYDKWIKENGKG